MDNYYDSTASGYDELHEAEQDKKLSLIRANLDVKKEDKLLDVGCGTGLSSSFDCNVIGIDPSQKMLEIARKKGINVKRASAEKIPFPDHEFDIVISVTCAQNFDDINMAVKEIRRVGKKRFVISILKNSEKNNLLEKSIQNHFDDFKIRKIAEEKDLLFFIEKG